MTILISTDQIYLHGGIEKVMATKVNYWAKDLDNRVFIVTTEQHGKLPCYDIDANVKMIDLAINYDRSQSYFSLANLKKSLSHFQKQKKLFEKLQPDIIISPNFNFDHYWLPVIKKKARLVKERHASRYLEAIRRQKPTLLRKLRYKFDDWIDSKYNHIIVLNKDEEAYVKSGNAVVIPNPVEISELRADISKKQIIAAGRLSPVKGFEDLIAAFALIQPLFPEWQLHFYGQDYLGTQQRLERLIEDLKLRETVFFKGNVNDMQETMTNYSIYAMTSETECFPMVLLEALSVGLPIVSYDCPNGPRNILKDGTDSFLVPHKNITIFAKKLKILMQEENLRQCMSGKGFENVRRFSVHNIMAQWNNLFHNSVN